MEEKQQNNFEILLQMADVEMIERNIIDEDDSKKKRIESYKTALKYYRSRSLSLDILLASKQAQPISDDMKTYGTLVENTKGLRDDITLLQSLKECVKLIQNSVTCKQINELNDFAFKKLSFDEKFYCLITKLHCYSTFQLVSNFFFF